MPRKKYDPGTSTIPQIISHHFKNIAGKNEEVVINYFGLPEWNNPSERFKKKVTNVANDIFYDGKNDDLEWDSSIISLISGKVDVLRNYFTKEDVITVRSKTSILGEDYSDLENLRDEYSEDKMNTVLGGIAKVANKKGCRVANLSGLYDSGDNVLTFTNTPNYETEITDNVLVFGEMRTVKIPKVALHPRTGESMSEYAERGANPYSKWDRFYRDTKSNVVYAASNKNTICIMVKRYVLSALNMVVFEESNTKEEVEKRLDVIYESSKDAMLSIFSERTVQDAKKNYDNLKSQIDDGDSKLRNLEQQYAELGRKLHNAKRDLAAFDVNGLTEQAKEEAKKQFNKLYKLKGVSHVDYTDGRLNIYTDNMYIKETREGREAWHDMGTFKIVVNWDHPEFNGEFIRIYPLKWKNISSTYITSHVMQEATFCYGNTLKTFSMAYAKRDVFGIVFHVLDMLRSQNTSDPAAVADKFPVVDEAVVKGDFGKELTYTDLDPAAL